MARVDRPSFRIGPDNEDETPPDDEDDAPPAKRDLRFVCVECPANATIHFLDGERRMVWVSCHGEHRFGTYQDIGSNRIIFQQVIGNSDEWWHQMWIKAEENALKEGERAALIQRFLRRAR